MRHSEVNGFVGRRMRHLRLHQGMSVTALSELMGVSFQQIQRYESGCNGLNMIRLYQLATIFNVSVAYFFDDAQLPCEIASWKQSVNELKEAMQVLEALVCQLHHLSQE